MKLGLGLGGTVLLGGGAAAWGLLARPAAASGRQVLGEGEVRLIEALADAHFPPGNVLGVAAVDLPMADEVDGWLAALGPTEQDLVRTLLALFDLWPRLTLTGVRRFADLGLEDRVALLRAFDGSSLPVRRALAQLMRLVVSMPYFEQPAVLARVGHRFGCAAIPPLEGSAGGAP